jgi:hypothetical protein
MLLWYRYGDKAPWTFHDIGVVHTKTMTMTKGENEMTVLVTRAIEIVTA